MIIISQVAGLSRKLGKSKNGSNLPKGKKPSRNDLYNWNFRGFDGAVLKNDNDDEDLDDELRERIMSTELDERSPKNAESLDNAIDATNTEDDYTKRLNRSEKFKINQLLDRWEEPQEEKRVGKISIQGILQFKQTLAFMDLSYPFSAAFGLADKREHCIESAQEVYKDLLCGNKDEEASDATSVLQFETLTELARKEDGVIDDGRIKDLVGVFRPDRDGKLGMVDFLRSVDQVYKDLRLLRASIANSSQIDRAFEAIINVIFYFIVGCIVLAAWGIDPLALFLSLSSFIVAFSFMVGSTSAKYFEGLMFILGRTPYDIGDRISINGPDEAPSGDGVFTWYVENVTLYYTTLRLGATNEVATIANSNLSNARIINAARSPRALVYITLKFGIDTPYAKLQLFKQTVESFVKAHPREWLTCAGIRATKVMAELGYVEYIIILQHRDSWQQISGILGSKADVMNYCLEVQKQLNIKYTQPATPVDVTVKTPGILSGLLESDGAGDPTVLRPEHSPSDLPHKRMQSQDLRNIAALFTNP